MDCPRCLENPCICGFDAEVYNRDIKRFLPDPPDEINIDLDLLDNDETPELQFEDEDGPSYRESDDDDDEFFNDTL